MKSAISLFLVLFIAHTTVEGQFQEQIVIPVDDYEQANPDSIQWEPLELNADRRTSYTLVSLEDSSKAIKAQSNNAASGLIYRVDIDPEEYPIIEWKWKVEGILENGDATSKKGDDYAARLYITFEYDKSRLGLTDRIKYWAIKTFTSYEIPLRSVNYVWGNKASRGTVVPNPYTDWVQMYVCRSGSEKTGRWIQESKNVYKNFQQAFNEQPGKITGIAIMTDTYNTGETATGYYGDIVFKKRPD